MFSHNLYGRSLVGRYCKQRIPDSKSAPRGGRATALSRGAIAALRKIAMPWPRLFVRGGMHVRMRAAQ